MSSVESVASNNVTVVNNNTNAPTSVSNQTSVSRFWEFFYALCDNV